MSASPLMSLGIRGMAASYAALQTTGHNITNANVRGYSRQSVELATAEGQFTGGGFFGKGVNVVSVKRAHDAFLTLEASRASSLASMDGARLEQLKRLETLFAPGERGLGNAASELFNAFSDLANRPGDLSSRQVVLARAQDLALRYRDAGVGMQRLQDGATAEMRTVVAEVNGITRAIAAANERIAGLRGSGQAPNDLLDERDRQIARLSELVQVTRIEADDGTMAVFAGGGQRLVLGSEAASLRVVADASDPSRSAVAVVDGDELRELAASAMGGGALSGLLRFQNEDLVKGRNLVGRLAMVVGEALNAQQLRGVSLQQPLGAVPSSPLFAVGAPQALANAGNARDGNGAPIGNVALTVVDASALQASDYSLSADPQGNGWLLTRLSDGRQQVVNGGDVVDGMRIDIANAQAGDRFLLQPVGAAASGMAALLSDPRDLAAASALQALPARTNTGTAVVDRLVVTAAPLPDPAAIETFTFTRLVPPQNGFDYEVSSSFTGTSSPWRTGMPLVGGNGFTLSVSGVPADGDTITVSPTAPGALAADNGNALAFTALREAALVDGGRITDGWAQAMAEVGVTVQTAQSASELSGVVARQAEQFRSADAGVNLDEEAARLIQYQQAYQAAAKVLQVAQSLMDQLLQTAGG